MWRKKNSLQRKRKKNAIHCWQTMSFPNLINNLVAYDNALNKDHNGIFFFKNKTGPTICNLTFNLGVF